jgi:predicted transcriptional regulator
MAPRESEAMMKAKDLVVNEGLTPYLAAKLVGLSPSAIYMTDWYAKWKNENPCLHCKYRGIKK